MNRVFVVCAIATAACHGRDAAPSAAPVPAPSTIDASVADPTVTDASNASPRSHDYKAALRRGRQLAHEHDWGGAVASFESAVAAAPGDARALSELGWAALHAGDLDRAVAASTSASTAAGASTRVRAASLYNLGRAKEAKGDRAGAETAYRASLALRSSRTVKRHLRSIGKGSIAIEAPIAAAASPTDADDGGLAGPFAKIEDYCAASSDDDAPSVTCEETSGLGAGVDHQGDVKIVSMRGELDDVTCLIAIHATSNGGWYVWDGIPCATTTAAGTDWAASIALDTPAPGRLLARFAIGVAVRDDHGAHHACEELAVACRLDHPACASAPIAWAARCPDAPTGDIRWDVTADAAFDGDALVVRGVSADRAAPDGLTDIAAVRVPLR
ncbi:MAG TPA: hypothetical protein VL463_31480 [Kofleriaceae bacterium]|nr:hypothetical protein [Kofleriaceae bacterium]